MAAVKVINHTPFVPRLPKDVPLPPSPADSTSPPPPVKKKSRKSKTKEKEKVKEGVQEIRRQGEQERGNANEQHESEMPQPEPLKPLTWASLTDSNSNSHPPIFTKDGSHFFSIARERIKIHSTSSGKVISTLPGPQDDGHQDIITSAILSANNAFQLITVSLDGTIKVWDFLEGILLHTINLEQPIHHVCGHEKIKDYVFVATAKAKKKGSSDGNEQPKSNRSAKASSEESCIILRVSLKPQNPASGAKWHKSSQITPVGKTRYTAGLAVSASGEWLIAVAGHKAYVAQMSALKSGFTKYVSPDALTCLAVHPLEDYFATGDAKGVVRLWYCLNQARPVVANVEKRSQTSELHWHAHAVSSVAFTTNGAYLLSGGEEATLVIWQLHSGKKEFVPRVGSPIKNVVVSRSSAAEEEYLLGLADASFAFISSATLKLSRVFSRIKLDSATSSAWASSSSATPLAVHSLSSTLVLPSSHPSSLQTYSPSSSTLVAELEVSPSNRVSRQEEKMLEPSRVERVVISSSGEWMATVDRREGDESFRGEIYLKIWWWDKKSAFWILNTRVDRPHGLNEVTSMSFSPSDENWLVTTGEDRNVKTWRIRSTKDKKGNVEVSWTSRSSFGFRLEMPRDSAWSPDGSLLAVALDGSVALYDSISNALHFTIVCSECPKISSLRFIGHHGQYIAVLGGPNLVVCDIINRSVRWHRRHNHPYVTLVPHPYQDTFVTIHRSPSDTTIELMVYSISSSTPLLSQMLPFGIRNLVWYPVPNRFARSRKFSLVGVTHAFGVVLLGHDINITDEASVSTKALQNGLAVPKGSLFEEMFGVPALTDVSHNAVASTIDTSLPWKSSETGSVFVAPAYLMPPMESLFEPLINGFLKLRLKENVDEEHQSGIQGVADEMTAEPMDIEEPAFIEMGKVSKDDVLDTFIPFFKDITGLPDYPFHSDTRPVALTLPTTPSSHHAKPAPRTVASQKPNPNVSPKKQASTPSVPAKTGKKRSRHSLV
ncbi:WD40-repeat-containing domain protein [Suillus fuscotomentosus]|uniref:WD40-repeat-containing domain protein n=1 Tax=Suillus fuscotomentosus TaxID=1912939 RepID=A0AAD4EED7_9AGAM|nr:WD40-repeat-containing domain protein [Suillus fuscotomentosus]KAG1904703.1 WD40-repeat-containing domain protein [Suillus fuscotomentosus]